MTSVPSRQQQLSGSEISLKSLVISCQLSVRNQELGIRNWATLIPISYFLFPISYFLIPISLLILFLSFETKAQVTNPISKPKIAVFAPVYLDSAYDASGMYKQGKSVPRYMINGLEFLNGINFALDTLEQQGKVFDVFAFDTRDPKVSLKTILDADSLQGLDLVIGAVSGNDYLQLAQACSTHRIPFVSATYPNDGGIKDDPGLVIVNSKLNTHLQSVYNHVQRNHAMDRVIWVRNEKAGDDRATDVIKELNAGTASKVLKAPISLKDDFTLNDFLLLMDSTKINVVLVSSLEEAFTVKVAATLAPVATPYKIHLVGMPNWEGIAELKKSQYNALAIFYSSTFYTPGTDPWSKAFLNQYFKYNYSKPSDLAFKGYELMHYFGGLLYKFPGNFMQHLNEPAYKVFSDYDFRAVRFSKEDTEPDYWENKRVYILKRYLGAVSRVY